MTISAKIIADSISPQGIRLTTLQLHYPKFIHGEFMTHRVFSRNASSSRAIPVERLIQDVMDDPAMPVFWGKNKRGMQAVEELESEAKELAKTNWLTARNFAVLQAKLLTDVGVHKQIVNRIIEPWCHINVVVTATEWENFFTLRRHKDAQPEMKALADAMYDAMEKRKPFPTTPGIWHLPYITELDHQLLGLDYRKEVTNTILIKLSVARCARVSYLTHNNKEPNIEEDLKLYERLIGSTPLHASPAEHQATPDIPLRVTDDGTPYKWTNPHEHGNLYSWRQYRKMLPNENIPSR